MSQSNAQRGGGRGRWTMPKKKASDAEKYLTVSEVAKRLGCSQRTAGRAAASSGVGIVAGGRVVAIRAADIETLKASVHWGPGNPNWVSQETKDGRRSRALS